MATPHHSASSLHQEFVLEEHLVSQLVQNQGYIERNPHDYDCALALDKELVLRFVRQTQPDAWKRLEAQYTTSAEAEFLKQLGKKLKDRSTIEVFRQGFKIIPGIPFSLYFPKPASGLNPDLVQKYE